MERCLINVNASSLKISELFRGLEAVRKTHYVEDAALSFSELLMEVKDLKEEKINDFTR